MKLKTKFEWILRCRICGVSGAAWTGLGLGPLRVYGFTFLSQPVTGFFLTQHNRDASDLQNEVSTSADDVIVQKQKKKTCRIFF